jgi:hypothetical protein
MKGTLVVDNPAEYQAWLKERAELSGTTNAPPPLQRPEGEPAPEQNQGTVPPPGAPKVGDPSNNPKPSVGTTPPAAAATSPQPETKPPGGGQ